MWRVWDAKTGKIPPMDALTLEIAETAARMVVEEGLEYGPAKRRAAAQLGAGRAPLPANDVLEDAVRAYIELFCGDTQPGELLALRQLALVWMQRMEAFRPYLCGPVWQGTANRLSDVTIQLFCDDPKSAEIALIDHRVPYTPTTRTGFRGAPVEALDFASVCPELGEAVGMHLVVYDLDDLRGALKPDPQGRTPRGDISAVRRLLQESA